MKPLDTWQCRQLLANGCHGKIGDLLHEVLRPGLPRPAGKTGFKFFYVNRASHQIARKGEKEEEENIPMPPQSASISRALLSVRPPGVPPGAREGGDQELRTARETVRNDDESVLRLVRAELELDQPGRLVNELLPERSEQRVVTLAVLPLEHREEQKGLRSDLHGKRRLRRGTWASG